MKVMSRVFCLLAAVSLLLCLGPAAGAAEVFSYSWSGVAFETPVGFSQPVKIGMGAAALTHPPNSGPGQGKLVLTLVEVPKDMQEGMGNDPAQVMAYVKSTYLGTAKPAQSTRERTFLGKVVKGGVQGMSIPRPGELEVYLVTLAGGDQMAVALTRDQGVPAAEAAKVMEMVARTFRLAPKK